MDILKRISRVTTSISRSNTENFNLDESDFHSGNPNRDNSGSKDNFVPEKRIARGTYFIRNKFLGKTLSEADQNEEERDIPPGYCIDDYDLGQALYTSGTMSCLFSANYIPLQRECSILKVSSLALPRGMDIYSILTTLYEGRFASFLPQFGCDFVDMTDNTYVIVLEPCNNTTYTSLDQFVKEFAELSQVELKCRILARLFSKILAFVQLSHEEETMGWFDYQSIYITAGYQSVKFFGLGFGGHEGGGLGNMNMTRTQKIFGDFGQIALLQEKILNGCTVDSVPARTNQNLLETVPSLRSFCKCLHSMMHVEDATQHPFLLEYDAKNRIDLLYQVLIRNGSDSYHNSAGKGSSSGSGPGGLTKNHYTISGNCVDTQIIMNEIDRSEQYS